MAAHRIVPAAFVLAACASAGPPPSPPDAPAAHELIVAEAFSDLPHATCVAQNASREAKQHANRLSQAETSVWVSQTRAQVRAEAATRAMHAANLESLRAQSVAAGQPTDPAAKRAAQSASGFAALTLDQWRGQQEARAAAARTAELVAVSVNDALRYAELAETHETLFLLERDLAAGRAAAREEIERRKDRTIDALRARIAAQPGLELLYAERFLVAYESGCS